MAARGKQNILASFLVAGLIIGAIAGYLTRPETAEIKLGPLSVEVRGNQAARAGDPVTSGQVKHIAIVTLIGGVIGLGLGFAIKSGRIKV
jgi:uncharacterized Zn-binding protein involved in type VI secretion